MEELQSNAVSERREIEQLAPSFLELSDAILKKVDPKTLSVLIAAYVYFKSNGRNDTEYVNFLLTKETPKVLEIGFGILPAMISGIIFDGKFRSVILSIARKLIITTVNP